MVKLSLLLACIAAASPVFAFSQAHSGSPEMMNGNPGKHGPAAVRAVAAPEIDTSGGAIALTMLAGSLMVLKGSARRN